MPPLIGAFDAEASAAAQLVATVLMAVGVLYANLRKTARKDAAADDARDKSLAAAYQKIHNQTLDRHAAEYARWTEERDSWRDQMVQSQERQSIMEKEIDTLREENRECLDRDMRKDYELKQVKDEQVRIKAVLKAKGVEWDTAVYEIPPELRKP